MDGDADAGDERRDREQPDRGASASTSICPASGTAARVQATSGRLGRMRIAITLPTTAPTPPSATIVAQAPAPPRSAFAITGPSTIHAQKPRLPIPNSSDRRPQPRPRGELVPALAQLVDEALALARVRPAARSGSAYRIAAQARKLTASMPRAHPGLPATTSAPPIAGPRIPVRFAAQALERVRLLEPAGADGLRHEPDLGRDDEPAADAVEPLQRHDRRDRRRSR